MTNFHPETASRRYPRNTFFLVPLGLDLTLAADRRDLPGLAQGYAHASSRLYGTPLEVVVDGRFILHPLQEWTGAVS